MASPKQRSLELPSYINRFIPLFQNPGWMVAQRWREVVMRQQIAGLCQNNIIRDLQGSQFEIRSRDPNEEDKLADDIEHYTDVVNPDMVGALSGFDIWVDLMAKDLLSIPMGANCEVVRYPDGMGPLSQPHTTKGKRQKGHVAWLAYIDGGTLSVTYDHNFPIMQALPGNVTERVFFTRDQIARTVMDTRSEMQRWGYGTPPPERIFLALEMLVRADTYYANLLIDTPEAGLLSLGDMDVESAKEWLGSFRELLTGIDPFKIPVIYEVTTDPKYIPFNRPPTELMVDTQTLKYAQIVCAAYGLTLTDINLGDPGRTLAGSIRDERRSRRSGYGTIKEKVKQLIDNEVMPEYLEFVWLENDTETKTGAARAFLTAASALEKAHKMRAMTEVEVQAQLVKDGHITVEVEEPEEIEAPDLPMLPPDGQTQNEMDKVPPSQGGRGDVTERAELGDPTISAAPTDAPGFDQLAAIFRTSFNEMRQRAGRPQLMKLVKAATRLMLPDVTQAFIELSQAEIDHHWLDARLGVWFGEIEAEEQVQKAADEILDALEEILDGEDWWRISPDLSAIVMILKGSFEQGATIAAESVREFLYTEGLADSPNIIGLNFALKNPGTLAQLETRGAALVRQVNAGTKYFLKRIITAGVDEGLSSQSIAQMIRDGADARGVLAEGSFTENVIRRSLEEIGQMSDNRIASIVNTEINKAESTGRLEQWRKTGLTRKAWRHTGPADVCRVCQSNIDMGFIPMAAMFRDVFGETLTPPGHPQVCHCHLVFDEEELIDKADTLEIWTGE